MEGIIALGMTAALLSTPRALAAESAGQPDRAIEEAAGGPARIDETSHSDEEPRPAGFLEVIEVTAEKRKQDPTKIGATIEAFSGEDLRAIGVGTTHDIQRLTSNVDIKLSNLGVNPSITIRGVGLHHLSSNNNPTVGIYLDELLLSSPAMLTLFMMDVDRVEILKGPQGTLYGRNTNGGAIKIQSRRPSAEKDGFLQLTLGDYETLEIEGAYGGRLTESTAGRFSLTYRNQGDSYFENLLDGSRMGSFEEIGLRGQVGFDRGPLRGHLNLFYLEQSGFNGLKEIYGTQDVNDPSSLCAPAAHAIASGRGFDITGLDRSQCVTVVGTRDPDEDLFRSVFDPTLEDRLRLDTEAVGGILDVSYDLAGMTLTSISGYIAQSRQFGEGSTLPGGLFFAEHDEEIDQISHELRISGETPLLAWLGGLLLSGDEIETFNPFESPGVFGPFFGVNPAFWDFDQETTSWAVFSSLSWRLAERVTLVTGARYTDETVEFTGGTTAFAAGESPFARASDLFEASQEERDEYGIPLTRLTETIADDHLSWRLALEFQPTDDVLVYGSASTGFKSGGFMGDFTIENFELEPFGAEELLAYEVGTKLTMGQRYQLNAAVFSYDYDNVQTFVPSTVGFKLDNLENAEITGVDLQLTARPVVGLDLLFGVGYNDSEVRSGFENYDGNVLPNAPRWQSNFLGRYLWNVAGSLWLSPQLVVKYSDEKYTEATNHPLNFAKSYATVDLRLSLFPTSNRWDASVWARNLTDERYFQEVVFAGAIGTVDGIPGAPRTIGLSFTYRP